MASEITRIGVHSGQGNKQMSNGYALPNTMSTWSFTPLFETGVCGY